MNESTILPTLSQKKIDKVLRFELYKEVRFSRLPWEKTRVTAFWQKVGIVCNYEMFKCFHSVVTVLLEFMGLSLIISWQWIP